MFYMFIMLDKLLKHARFILGFSQPLDQGVILQGLKALNPRVKKVTSMSYFRNKI